MSKSEIVVQMNNLVGQSATADKGGKDNEDEFGGSPQSDQMPDE